MKSAKKTRKISIKIVDEITPADKYMVIIRWSEEDKVFVATVPELPGCATHGSTREEAATYAREAITGWLEVAREANIPIPEPAASHKYSGKFLFRCGEELHRKIAIKALSAGESLTTKAIQLVEKGLEQEDRI